jgi:hypothetical protein
MSCFALGMYISQLVILYSIAVSHIIHCLFVPLAQLQNKIPFAQNQIRTSCDYTRAANMSEYEFKGWIAHDKQSANVDMKWEPFQPKTFEEDHVDVQISHCGTNTHLLSLVILANSFLYLVIGICGTDLHTLRSGWFPAEYPTCVGHE